MNYKVISTVTTAGQTPLDLDPIARLETEHPFIVNDELLRIEAHVKGGGLLTGKAIQVLGEIAQRTRPQGGIDWPVIDSARRILKLNPVSADRLVSREFEEAQRALRQFLAISDAAVRSNQEPKLITDLKAILLREGMAAFDTWLKYDWMLKRGTLPKYVHDGPGWYIILQDGHHILVVVTWERGYGRHHMEDHQFYCPIEIMLADQSRESLKRIGIEGFRSGYGFAHQREDSKVAVTVVQKLHGAAPGDLNTVFDQFLQLAEIGALDLIQLEPGFSRARAEVLVGEHRSPYCIPFLLWGDLCDQVNRAPKREQAERLTRAQEAYNEDARIYFQPVGWNRAIAITTRAYKGAKPAIKDEIAWTLLHHFLPTLQIREPIQENIRQYIVAAESALLEMVSQFSLWHAWYAGSDLAQVYEELQRTRRT